MHAPPQPAMVSPSTASVQRQVRCPKCQSVNSFVANPDDTVFNRQCPSCGKRFQSQITVAVVATSPSSASGGTASFSMQSLGIGTDSLGTSSLSMKMARPRKRFHAMLSHDWGTDCHGRKNHDRVAQIKDALHARGVLTWFDGERMQGNMMNAMASGIDQSHVVVAFITRSYIKKVAGKNEKDYCKMEFNYASSRGVPLLAVPMEAATLEPRSWTGPVGVRLGCYFYPAQFANEISEDEIDKLTNSIFARLS